MPSTSKTTPLTHLTFSCPTNSRAFAGSSGAKRRETGPLLLPATLIPLGLAADEMGLPTDDAGAPPLGAGTAAILILLLLLLLPEEEVEKVRTRGGHAVVAAVEKLDLAATEATDAAGCLTAGLAALTLPTELEM